MPPKGARGRWLPERREVEEVARFSLAGKPLPRIEDAVRIGELARAALTSRAKRVVGEDRIPPLLSGHGEKDPRHAHAFFLPEDADGDGWIDHLIIFALRGFDPVSRNAISRLDRLFQGGGGEWRVALEGIFPVGHFGDSPLLGKSSVWRSVTPYLHPWFAKKNFQPADQIWRECQRRGYPTPVDVVSEEIIAFNGRQLRPIHFHRFRAKKGLTQPDRHGGFWRIVFPEPVTGPIALGFGCHFGLGLFALEKADHM
jgi:CRISPR-associated protein Csb2